MGLPGSGKTTLAEQLYDALPDSLWLNADLVREKFNDWDFSDEGRIRQARRMHTLANESTRHYVIVDFVAALEDQRKIFDADLIVWMDTIQSGRFVDTNKAFVPPTDYALRFTSFDEVDVKKVLALVDHSH
jgi:adenylylsulfate kinase